MDEESLIASWIPDLVGPIFQPDRFTLKEALDLQDVDEQIHLMATFLPDEIIRGIVFSEKSPRSFRAVLLSLNILGTELSMLFMKCVHTENMGSLTFTTMLSDYIGSVVCEIYQSEGDVLKLSAGSLLAAWKVRDDQFTFDTVQRVIDCAIRVRDSNHDRHLLKANITISAGEVTLFVIGNDEARNFVLHGAAIDDLRYAGKTLQPNDLVLSFSAWKHCTPSRYEYVVKDSRNVKIIKVLTRPQEKATSNAGDNSTSERRKSATTEKTFSRTTFTHEDFPEEIPDTDARERISSTISVLMSANPNFKTLLKSYLIQLLIQQIEKDRPLDFLTVIKHITTVSLDIFPEIYTDEELILLVDKCFLLIHSVVTQYAGYIYSVDLYEKRLLLYIMFGIRGDQRQGIEVDEVCNNGITCAMQVLQTVKSIARIYHMSVGVSTGLAYCGVIGDTTRKHYSIIGPSVDRAAQIMDISYDKISCDYNTVLHSRLSKNQFRSQGLRTLKPSGKCQVYEYLKGAPQEDDSDEILLTEYCYPILGREQELDEFDDILDEIGVAGRTYSGLLIEGVERSGKSRLLDAFVANVRNRQIRPIELSLHATYTEKTNAALHHVILQILEAEDCNTIGDRQKVLLSKLMDVIAPEDLCYLNDLMRVCFPLSKTYCSENNWQRLKKTFNVFESILKQLKTKICILLDDVQYMDDTSWQFLSSALDHNHVVMAMTMLTTESNVGNYVSRTQAMIYADTRLMKRTLHGLRPQLLPALTCQFLNVLALPRKLTKTLLAYAEGHVGWCEMYLTLLLQSNALYFIRISPNEANQRDLVFPDGRMITRLPIDLTPQELPPPLAWSRMRYLNVCDVNERYTDEVSEIDTRGLMYKIYERMTPFERVFVACAATLGTVFKRNVLLNALPEFDNSEHDINTTISEMFRLRILECGFLQRRDFHFEDLVLCILKKRRTFSDMLHSVTCNCHLSRQTIADLLPPLGTHCKTLEFKVDLFRKTIYDAQPEKKKQQHHARAVEIYGRNARRCNSCGSGAFLRIPGEDLSTRQRHDIYSIKASLARHKKKSSVLKRDGFAAANSLSLARRQEFFSDTRRVSIMPTYLDHEDADTSTLTQKNEEIGEKLMSGSSRFWRRVSGSDAPETTRKHNRSDYLDAFGHIDYRNCRCDGVISCLFWRLHQHIENSGEVDKIIDFLMEYSSGLIEIAQPSHAIKLLAIAAERNEKTVGISNDEEKSNMNKGIILALTGDAHSALGNYSQAKRYYAEAVTLRSVPLKVYKVLCYGLLITMRVHRKLLELPRRHVTNEKSGQLTAKRLELASYTRRLCLAFMREDKLKAAKLFTLQSYKAGFPSFDGFLEKDMDPAHQSGRRLDGRAVLYSDRGRGFVRHDVVPCSLLGAHARRCCTPGVVRDFLRLLHEVYSSQIEVLCESRPAELLPFVDVPVDLPTQDGIHAYQHVYIRCGHVCEICGSRLRFHSDLYVLQGLGVSFTDVTTLHQHEAVRQAARSNPRRLQDRQTPREGLRLGDGGETAFLPADGVPERYSRPQISRATLPAESAKTRERARKQAHRGVEYAKQKDVGSENLRQHGALLAGVRRIGGLCALAVHS